MMRRIEKDRSRFKDIVRKAIRKDLEKYITHAEMIGRQGEKTVSIPVPQIELPRFKFELKKTGGVGQGEGDVGTPIGSGKPKAGSGEAGNMPGKHILEAEVALEELVEMLGEKLELPNIEPKGKKNIVTKSDRYTGISNVGPKSLRHFKRTYREALKRQLETGEYDPENPVIVPIKRDERFRTWKEILKPESNAVIFHIMDVSGSMGEQQKAIVRITCFWIELWLHSQYKGIEIRYIAHDYNAREVNQHRFYHTHENGGTRISSAYEVLDKIITNEYSIDDWNIYVFQFSDGDNWGGDNTTCHRALGETILRYCNLFCYGQVPSQWGGGDFYDYLFEHLTVAWNNLTLARIDKREGENGILPAIKTFLGKGL